MQKNCLCKVPPSLYKLLANNTPFFISFCQTLISFWVIFFFFADPYVTIHKITMGKMKLPYLGELISLRRRSSCRFSTHLNFNIQWYLLSFRAWCPYREAGTSLFSTSGGPWKPHEELRNEHPLDFRPLMVAGCP